MRCYDDVLASEQRMSRRQGLRLRHVQCSAREQARIQRGDERIRLDRIPAPDVDDDGGALEEGNRLRGEDVPRRGRRGEREQDDVGLAEELCEGRGVFGRVPGVGDTERTTEMSRMFV